MSVCQTCGNKGWPQALVICNKCHTIAVHSYCQYKLPTNDEGEVTLACEFCEPRAIEQSDSTEMPGFSDVREFQDFQDIEHPRCLLTKESSSLSRGTEKSHNTIKQMHSSGEDSEDTQVETYHSDSAETSSESEEDIYGAVQPMHDPIWMGCFTIHGIYSCIVNEMLAHMSTEACEEASDVASLLPAILHLRMVPITDIWPVKFRKMQPTVHNISVYFFPENWLRECMTTWWKTSSSMISL